MNNEIKKELERIFTTEDNFSCACCEAENGVLKAAEIGTTIEYSYYDGWHNRTYIYEKVDETIWTEKYFSDGKYCNESRYKQVASAIGNVIEHCVK